VSCHGSCGREPRRRWHGYAAKSAHGVGVARGTRRVPPDHPESKLTIPQGISPGGGHPPRKLRWWGGLRAHRDMPEANPMWHEWFRDLQEELSDDAQERIEQLREKPVEDRPGEIPLLLEEEVRRIERSQWKLL
jgi:hypothetical protein